MYYSFMNKPQKMLDNKTRKQNTSMDNLFTEYKPAFTLMRYCKWLCWDICNNQPIAQCFISILCSNYPSNTFSDYSVKSYNVWLIIFHLKSIKYVWLLWNIKFNKVNWNSNICNCCWTTKTGYQLSFRKI